MKQTKQTNKKNGGIREYGERERYPRVCVAVLVDWRLYSLGPFRRRLPNGLYTQLADSLAVRLSSNSADVTRGRLRLPLLVYCYVQQDKGRQKFKLDVFVIFPDVVSLLGDAINKLTKIS